MSNINKIRQAMPKYGCTSMLITSQVNRLYATGFPSSAGIILVTQNDTWFIVDSRYVEAARNAVEDANVVLISKDETMTGCLKSIINANGILLAGFEDNFVSYATHKEWSEQLAIELVPAQKLFNDLREIKSSADLDKMIKAQRISEKVFEEILPLISVDVTEKDIAAEIIYRSIKHGADDVSFDPIVISGSKSSMPHGVPGNEKIGKGFLTFDFGAKLDGWCSDTTRTICIGQPDDEMVNVYDTVLKAQEAGINAVYGGVKGIDVDTAARNVIEEAGYGEYFGHGFSHSLGLEVHESLKASQLSKDILPAGAVISAEPGIYLPGRFGVRIEDTLIITEDGYENMTKLPKSLIVL